MKFSLFAVKLLFVVGMALVVMLPSMYLTGCNQSTVAALVTTFGNASASVAAMQGNAVLATKIRVDTAAASNAVLTWKSGSNAEMAIQAIHIVENDLNLICDSIPAPQCQTYEPLILLALSTADSIIAIIQANSPASQTLAAGVERKQIDPTAPKNADEFKKRWNSLVTANPQLQPVLLK
jgi:hypothetical protein